MLMRLYLAFNLVLLIVKQLCGMSFCVRTFLIVLSHQVLKFCTLNAVILCRKFKWSITQRQHLGTWVSFILLVGQSHLPSTWFSSRQWFSDKTTRAAASVSYMLLLRTTEGPPLVAAAAETWVTGCEHAALSAQMEQIATHIYLMVLSYRSLNTC